uniref:ASD2 domain-containing protein n=1 Tax=Eptatretus burgeri TaxID=7764 RepID=A0A8C4N807_EPTBU
MFLDLDMVVNLLLSICGRLARVESAISCLPKSTEPRMSRKQLDLQGKLEDARELQRDLKIRETTMAGLLASSLSPSQLKDYHHLIGLKASVLITQRHLEESLQSAEFQLDVLKPRLDRSKASA